MGHNDEQQKPVTRADLDQLEIRIVDSVTRAIRDLIDPVALSLLLAPEDDEPETDEERRDVAAARAEIVRGEGIPFEEIRQEFGG